MTSSLSYKDVDIEIATLHNPGLIRPNESPNGNRIYHLYSDGEITNQKGGFAYLQRSEFTNEGAIFFGPPKFHFPMQCGTISYAIMTMENCIKMREKMKLCN